MQVKTFALMAAALILVYVIELIRREKMTFKYSISWLASCVVVIFFTLQDQYLVTISRWVGFELPSNFIFFLLLLFVIWFSLILTVHINEQNSRAEHLAQSVALLQYQLKKLEEETKK